MLDEKNIGNDSSSLFNGNHFPVIRLNTLVDVIRVPKVRTSGE